MCDEAGEFDFDRELIILRSARSLPLTTRRRSEQLDTVVVAPTSPGTPAARRELRSIGRERIGPILLLWIRSFNLRAPQGGHGSHPLGDQRKVTGRDLYKPESEGRPPPRLTLDER